jgi:hypothetical protein
MANRESYPAQLFPLRGDLSAEAGAVSVTVTGIQATPVVATAPSDGQVLIAESGVWTLQTLDSSILINGIPVSDDYDIGVNLTLGISSSPVLVNGA